MDKRVTFPAIDGVKQSFLGIAKCKDFVTLLKDSDGKMLTNIFEDNVRDFQGYNTVNQEIRETILNNADQNRFALLNNGITIVAKNIQIIGDTVKLFDYQIVNGCQTSYVLFDNADNIIDDSYIVLKIIEVCDESISERVIFTTNRQTEVKAEAFTSTKRFHKNLQDFYNAIDAPYRLFYERRSKQYDLHDDVAKNRIITLAIQISSYVAVFLNEPHSTHRYYGELLRSYESKLFLDNDACEVYYIAAYIIFYLDNAFKAGKIPKEYRRYKFHIACAIKSLEVGSHVLFGQARKQKKEFEKLFDLIKNEEKMNRYLNSAISCLDRALFKCTDVPESDRHRSREVTKELLNNISAISNAQSQKDFLKVGDVVHCVVVAVHSAFVYVTLMTEDSRNYGSIHISKLTGEYIHNIHDIVSLSDTFQAKIIEDFYDNNHGWALSKIF